MTRTKKIDKKGVSPVIGVILMVAATIVISGVVIAMLGGFTAPGKTYAISASAEERSVGGTTTLYVTYQGGPDHAMVDALTGAVDGTDFDTIPTEWGSPDDDNSDVDVGAFATDATIVASGPNNSHIVVTANFLDGSIQVILDTYT